MSIRNYHRFMGYADPTERPEFKLPPKPELPIAAGETKPPAPVDDHAAAPESFELS